MVAHVLNSLEYKESVILSTVLRSMLMHDICYDISECCQIMYSL